MFILYQQKCIYYLQAVFLFLTYFHAVFAHANVCLSLMLDDKKIWYLIGYAIPHMHICFDCTILNLQFKFCLMMK